MIQNSLDPNHYYPSPTHEEALARLQFLVANRRRAGLLVGESGSGKSLVLRVLAEQVRRQGGQTAVVNLAGLEVDELLWQIAVQFKLSPADKLPRYAMWRLISDRVCENRHQQIATVILLDDVDQASEEMLLHVHRLVQVDSSPESCLTVISTSSLIGDRRSDEWIAGLSELRIELEPWQPGDIAMYLATGLDQIGRSDVSFESTAIDVLHQSSGGLPRRVHQLAELALLAATDRGVTLIDADTVDALHDELFTAAGH